jgi:hypothetical protein
MFSIFYFTKWWASGYETTEGVYGILLDGCFDSAPDRLAYARA